MKSYSTSLVLDQRRQLQNGLYPVKLRIYTPNPKAVKLYSTAFEESPEDFIGIWESAKPRLQFRSKHLKFQSLLNEVNEVCEELKPFSFETFEKKFFRNKGDGTNIVYHYSNTIAKLKENNSFGTASNYQLALNSIKAFILRVSGRNLDVIPFSMLNAEMLNMYENDMLNNLQRSPTTVSMYIRTLRTIFNEAIKAKEIEAELYPFGKGKYQPPNVRNVKKALPKDSLKQLFEAKPLTDEQERAKDFWFFSFTCNGMNVKDIALLKVEDIKGNNLHFFRAKTLKTAKVDLRPVNVYLTDYAKGIIKKYQTGKVKNDYLFSVISANDSAETQHKKIKNFTKSINQNLKKLAAHYNLNDDISTYWARHTFATHAVRNGASMEFVSEALNHHDLKTTQLYFGGFEEDDKKAVMEKLMQF